MAEQAKDRRTRMGERYAVMRMKREERARNTALKFAFNKLRTSAEITAGRAMRDSHADLYSKYRMLR